MRRCVREQAWVEPSPVGASQMVNDHRDLPGTVTPWLLGTKAYSLCRAAPPAQGPVQSMGTGLEWQVRSLWKHFSSERLSGGTDISGEEQKRNSVLPWGKNDQEQPISLGASFSIAGATGEA